MTDLSPVVLFTDESVGATPSRVKLASWVDAAGPVLPVVPTMSLTAFAAKVAMMVPLPVQPVIVTDDSYGAVESLSAVGVPTVQPVVPVPLKVMSPAAKFLNASLNVKFTVNPAAFERTVGAVVVKVTLGPVRSTVVVAV